MLGVVLSVSAVLPWRRRFRTGMWSPVMNDCGCAGLEPSGSAHSDDVCRCLHCRL